MFIHTALLCVSNYAVVGDVTAAWSMFSDIEVRGCHHTWLGLTKALWLRLAERLWFISTVNTLYAELCHDADPPCIKPRPQSLPNLNQNSESV